MSSFPNFRRIFQDSRSDSEEKQVTNAAVFKLVSFLAIVVCMVVTRKISFPSL
ncbi:hypothetical protein QVD99_002626 [Batrachochytrium dendrobatidis]|nr:hypothetical protein O5D80_006852 [Batrachochytrium dendrobatidis]KAK5670855.1 hypothetical protein QVD99_002626 [Batrachochytrium dendrobatidis]